MVFDYVSWGLSPKATHIKPTVEPLGETRRESKPVAEGDTTLKPRR